MVALALAMTVPAWADCKVQMVLKSSVLGASGTAEKEVDGAGEFDVKGATGTCDIHRVLLTSLTKAAVLSGNFDTAPLDPNDPPEVEIQIEKPRSRRDVLRSYRARLPTGATRPS